MTDLAKTSGILKEIHLIRHARPIISDLPRSDWPLDPAHADALAGLNDAVDLPSSARWFSSPERRAIETAKALTRNTVSIVEELREMARPPKFIDDFQSAVARAFAQPEKPGSGNWETVDSVAARQREALRGFGDVDEIVVVGHGVALTVLVALLTDQPPDFGAWQAMKMPDYALVDKGKMVRAWGDWG